MPRMKLRFTLKSFFVCVALFALLCVPATWFMNSRAIGFWGVGKMAITDGTPESPCYYVEIRGVGERAKVVRFVKFPNAAAGPRNMLLVAQAVVDEFDARTRNTSRFSRSCRVIVGRTIDERIVLDLPSSVVRDCFSKSTAGTWDFDRCEEFWATHVEPSVESR